jgi:hypothetical protein
MNIDCGVLCHVKAVIVKALIRLGFGMATRAATFLMVTPTP